MKGKPDLKEPSTIVREEKNARSSGVPIVKKENKKEKYGWGGKHLKNNPGGTKESIQRWTSGNIGSVVLSSRESVKGSCFNEQEPALRAVERDLCGNVPT